MKRQMESHHNQQLWLAYCVKTGLGRGEGQRRESGSGYVVQQFEIFFYFPIRITSLVTNVFTECQTIPDNHFI